MTGTTPEYQYHLKDHLGNVRMTFTSTPATDVNTGTYEDANATTEQSQFLRYTNAKRVYATLFDHTNGASPGYSERLNGSTNEKYGLARSMSVMPGDVIKLEVYAKYVDQNTSNWTGALTTLMSQIASSAAGVVVDGASYSSSTSSFPFAGALSTSGSTGGPKAYLNWLVFDRNYTLITGGYSRLSSTPKEQGQDVAHEKLSSPDLLITDAGYVYVYLSNEETTPVEVYFDDFKVTHTKSPVIQTDDYYPFGLTFNSYQRENSIPDQYQYSGKELQDELSLGWLDFGARMYMPEIGRWGVIDPHAGRYEIVTPYNYAFNNPLLFIDPTGADNIIYLLGTSKDKKTNLQDIAAFATKALQALGLKIEVKAFDSKQNGKFDPNKLSATDSYAVVGSDRKEVAKLSREIDRADNRDNRERNSDGSTDHEQSINAFEERANGGYNPETADQGQWSSDGKGRGISVDREDVPESWKTNKNEWAAFFTLHGAGHNV